MELLPPYRAFTIQSQKGFHFTALTTKAHLSLPENFKDGQLSLKDLIPIKALWDTGATNCVITDTLAKKLNLIPISKRSVKHADGISLANVYLIDLHLPNEVTFRGGTVTECKDTGSFDFIIGMDIITKGDFAITNVDGTSTFSFRIPSTEKIDFVKNESSNLTLAPTIGRNAKCPCKSGKKYKNCCGKVA